MMFGVKGGFYKEGEYGFIFSDIESKNKFSKWSSTYELTSVQNWIVKGVWDKQEFLDEIQRKFNPIELDDEQKFLSFSFWDLEQSNIDYGLPKAVNNAYNGKLTRDELINLLQKIHAMKEYLIPLPCEVDYLKMNEGFRYRKELVISNKIKEPKRYRFSEKDRIDAEAYNLYKDIENFDKKLYALEPRNRFIGYLNLEPGISGYEFRDKIIGCFDKELLDLFCERYLKSNNAHKRDMCFALMDLRFTDKEYMTIEERIETINNFKKLIETICNSEQNESDYITSAINKEFSKNIIEMIKRIERVDAE